MTLPFDLGRGVFHNLGSDLTLTLNASAEAKIGPEAAGTRKAQRILQCLQSGEMWLTQAPEIKLHICISVEPSLVHSASTFFSQTGELVRRSKIWPSLGLAVLFKSCDHVREGNGSDNVRLSFWLRKMPDQSTGSKPSRVPGSLQGTHEAVPPTGIPTGHLSSVTVSLEYRLKQDIGSYMKTQLYSTPTVISDGNSQDDTIAESLLSQTLYFPPEKPASIGSGKDIATAFARELQASSEDWSISLHDDSLQWTNDNGHTQQFNELLDMGLRNLITCKPAGTRSAIREDIPTHLAELAPAVFSRGYSKAMSQRSQFIPSIAKSMASILQRTPTRRQRPSAQDPHSEAADPSREGREAVDLGTKIKHSLWRTAQKQLFNPNASRNLPPLHSVFTLDEDLLDYIAGEDDSDALISNDDTEGCHLGMGSGFWDGSEGGYLFDCMAEEEDCLWLGSSDDDDNDGDDGDGLLDSIHGDELLDIDSDDGGQRSGCGGGNPLPSAGISSSFLPKLSSQWSRNFPSESEMLTDPVEENPNDGVLANDVDMLCMA